MNESSGGNLNAISSLDRRIKNVSDCQKAQQLALRDPAFANRRHDVQQLEKDTERRLHALQEEKLIREELSSFRAKPGNQADIATKEKKLADHVKRYPLYYGSLQVAGDPCFQCGATLRKLRNPSYQTKKDVQGKKQRRKERLALLSEARANAAKSPEGEQKRRVMKAADDFARNMDAAEKAILSRDGYHYTDAKINAEGAPTGYLRGSDNPEMLKRYGLTPEMLAPTDSKFRAELYIPDQEVFGADAKPVLVFKGTDPTCLEDCRADLDQAAGKPCSYYQRAFKLGEAMNKSTHCAFEAAGHSLGGGMASAVGTITGCLSTVFNPAGLHPNTVAPYNKNVTTDSDNVYAFVVDGEVVNSSQDAATGLGRKMMIYSAQSRLSLLSPVRFAPLIAGVQLSSVPTQVGVRTNLPAHVGPKTPNIVTRHLMDTVIVSIEQEKKKDQKALRQSLLKAGGDPYGTNDVG